MLLSALWSAGFGYLAVVRHLAGGTHAEDLGFTDQAIWNFLRGQFFRISIYNGAATWNTELDVSRIVRPDSLLAFHFEPMLLLLVPLYAAGGGTVALLVLQAVALGAGAIPAYRLGHHVSHSTAGGLAVAAAYLLSPLGQWAVLDDFHTSVLAAPLLIFSLERLIVARSSSQALIAACVAATAREDVGPVVALLGGVVLICNLNRRAGLTMLAFGSCISILAALAIRNYSGGLPLFDVRFGVTLGAGPAATLAALARPTVIGYAETLLLSGGWLGWLAPIALVPALPWVFLNALSASPWMAAGKAHYSVLALPFIVVAAAAALGRLRYSPRILAGATAALLVSSVIAYTKEGAGPFGGNYAPATLTAHAARAARLADSLPVDAGVSASASLVPRLSHRPRIYVFPAVLDAEYVFVDLKSSPAPTSAGDVFLRIQHMLGNGGWQAETADDDFVVLRREPDAAASALRLPLANDVPSTDSAQLLSAALVPSPDGAIDVDGPRWILRTVWRSNVALAPNSRLEFWINLTDGERLHRWDVADLWWNPPERWAPGKAVTVDVPDVPVRQFRSWEAQWHTT